MTSKSKVNRMTKEEARRLAEKIIKHGNKYGFPTKKK